MAKLNAKQRYMLELRYKQEDFIKEVLSKVGKQAAREFSLSGHGNHQNYYNLVNRRTSSLRTIIAFLDYAGYELTITPKTKNHANPEVPK